jgi:hypothetical protein
MEQYGGDVVAATPTNAARINQREKEASLLGDKSMKAAEGLSKNRSRIHRRQYIQKIELVKV